MTTQTFTEAAPYNSPLLDFIGFSYNWNNKLNCKAFTTIRLHNPKKYILNQKYRIQLKGEEIAEGKIVAIKDFFLKNITPTVCFIDTGYNVQETVNIIRKMYKDVDFTKQQLSLITIVKTSDGKSPG